MAAGSTGPHLKSRLHLRQQMIKLALDKVLDSQGNLRTFPFLFTWPGNIGRDRVGRQG